MENRQQSLLFSQHVRGKADVTLDLSNDINGSSWFFHVSFFFIFSFFIFWGCWWVRRPGKSATTMILRLYGLLLRSKPEGISSLPSADPASDSALRHQPRTSIHVTLAIPLFCHAKTDLTDKMCCPRSLSAGFIASLSWRLVPHISLSEFWET